MLLLRDGGRAVECRCFVHHDNVVVVSVRFVSDPFRFVVFVSFRFEFERFYYNSVGGGADYFVRLFLLSCLLGKTTLKFLILYF